MNPQILNKQRPRLSERFVLVLRVLIISGYPLVGVLVTYLGVQSNALTVPFRIAVVMISGLVFLTALRKSHLKRIPLTIIAFFLVYALRLSYDFVFIDAAGAGQALITFIALVVIPVTASMLVGPSGFQDSSLGRWLVMMTFAIMLLTLIADQLGFGHNPWADAGIESARLGFEALNPISLGNVAGIGILSSIYLLFGTRQERGFQFLALLLLPMAVMVLLLANSRGPLLAVAFGLLCFVLPSIRRSIFAFPLVLGLLFLIPSDNVLIVNVVDRFSGSFVENPSNAGRLMAQHSAFEAFLRYPIVGAHYIDPVLGTGFYPHNLIIETAMALGIVGLALMLTMVWRATSNALSYLIVAHPLLVMLLAQQFVMAQLTGALWGADSFFLLISIALATRRIPMHEKSDRIVMKV